MPEPSKYDRDQLLNRLNELLRDNEDATPFVLGYLSFGHSDETLAACIQRYMEHDEQLATLREATRLAEQSAKKVRPQD